MLERQCNPGDLKHNYAIALLYCDFVIICLEAVSCMGCIQIINYSICRDTGHRQGHPMYRDIPSAGHPICRHIPSKQGIPSGVNCFKLQLKFLVCNYFCKCNTKIRNHGKNGSRYLGGSAHESLGKNGKIPLHDLNGFRIVNPFQPRSCIKKWANIPRYHDPSLWQVVSKMIL